MRYAQLSPWRRAPLRAASIMSLSAGVAVAAFVLVLAAGSRPMFVSSAASGSLLSDIEDGCRFFVGLNIERPVQLAPLAPGEVDLGLVALDDATSAIDAAVAGISGLDRVVTMYGPRAQVSDAAGGGGGLSLEMLMVSRTGFEDHIEVITRTGRDGVWVPDNISTLIGVGDAVEAVVDGQTVTLPVAGTYVDLARERDESWCSVAPLVQEQRSGGPPPPLMLMDQELLVDTMVDTGQTNAFVRWEYVPPVTGWTLDDASATVDELQRIASASSNIADPLAQVLGRGEAVADSASSIQHAKRTSATVSSAAGPIALATAGVAMLVLLTAARSWLDRRRREVTVLALRGAGPFAIAVKAVLELLVPLLVGALGGLLASVLLVRAVGPSTRIEASAITAGIVAVAIALGVALVASALVVAAAVRRVAVDVDGAAPRQHLLWWEPPVLLLAAGAWYELDRRGSSVVGTTEVDSLALLFPFLLLAGGGGLLARWCLSARALRPLARWLPPAGWLAVRRLGARRLRAIAVVTSATVAVGIVVFAGSMSSSIRATAEAKTLLGPGAEQVVRVGQNATVPAGIGGDGHTTIVTRLSESGVLVRGHPSTDVLGVDPATFADAAFWDDSFADRSLSSLLADLDRPAVGQPIPVIAVGDELPDAFVLTLPSDDSGADIEVEVAVIGRADAFPGLGFRQTRPLVVMDREALADVGVTRSTEIWSDRPSPQIVQQLFDDGQLPVFVITAGDATAESSVRAQLWTVDYLELIGLAAALVTVAGLGLYFAASLARHRLGSAVARRMGMRRRTAAASTAIEIAAMLLAGWAFGCVLSWTAARLVYESFDPRPNAAPAALFRYGSAAAIWSGVAVVVVALLVAVFIEQGVTRRSMQRMLRDAE